MNRVRWTPDEDSYIFDTAGCPIGYVAETLGRTVRAVANRRLVVASATRDSDDRPMEGRCQDHRRKQRGYGPGAGDGRGPHGHRSHLLVQTVWPEAM